MSEHKNADEIVRALRCDVEQGNESGSRCYREGEDCRGCPNYYEGGDHIMAIDKMMLAAADLIESLQSELDGEIEQKRLLAGEKTCLLKELADARNELCQKCGRYHEAHKGACDGCRWKEKL